jgi:hypothetical protein
MSAFDPKRTSGADPLCGATKAALRTFRRLLSGPFGPGGSERYVLSFDPPATHLQHDFYSTEKQRFHIFCDNSAIVGSLPFGVNLSTIPGNTCDNCLVSSSSERPDFCASILMMLGPNAEPNWPGETG